MRTDLPTAANANQKLTIGDAREKLIQIVTSHWTSSLIELAQKLQMQGFSQDETLELCENMRPMFEQNLTQALRQFDAEADKVIARSSGNGGSVG